MINISWVKEIAEAKDELSKARSVIQARIDKKEIPDGGEYLDWVWATNNLEKLVEMERIEEKHDKRVADAVDIADVIRRNFEAGCR